MIAARKISDAERRRFDAAANRLDYWIRRHTVPLYCGTHPAQTKNNNSARDRLVGLSAIGQCLRDQYDCLATPIPPHLAALVEQLKMQK
jgi:hypothetical protein